MNGVAEEGRSSKLHKLRASEELPGVRAPRTALVLLSCVLSGSQSRDVFLDSSALREPEARDADLCQKGSP